MEKLTLLKGTRIVSISIPEQKIFDEKPFPLVLSPENKDFDASAQESFSWVAENKEVLIDLLTTHGAILFRNFPTKTLYHFNDFSLSFGFEPLPYIGGAAPRSNIHGVVHTTNESPPERLVPFHHEMAQVPVYPKKLFFYCEVPPKEGGETPICLSNQVYLRLVDSRKEFIDQLEAKGVKYTRVIPQEDDPSSAIGRGWQSTFLTTDRAVAEERAKTLGVDLEWLPGGLLKTVSGNIPAIREDPRIKQKTFFNSIVAAYIGWRDSRNTPETAVTFSDGTPFNPKDIEETQKIMKEVSVAFKWEQGDILFIDNALVLHSRNCFTPPRSILAALFK